MYRRIFTVLFLFTVGGFLMAQSSAPKKMRQDKMEIYKETNSTYSVASKKPTTVFPVKNNPTGDTVAQTKFGIFANGVIRQQIKYYNGVPNILGVIIPNSKGNRSVTYYTPTNGLYAGIEVPGASASTNRTGWGAIDIAQTGTNPGTIGIVSHTPNILSLYDPSTKTFSQSVINAYTDPSIAFAGDVIYLADSGNRDSLTGFCFWKTTDYGQTFNMFDKIKNYPDQVIVHAQASTEIDLVKSPNEKYLAYVGGSAHVASTDPSPYDNCWLFNSTDAGASWKAQTIGTRDSIDILKDYPGHGTMVDFYFGQNEGAVSNDGVFHVVSNAFGGDTTRRNSTDDQYIASIYPVAYWNSNLNYWKAVSDYNVDTVQNMNLGRIGNGMGQCWPTISTSADGQVVFLLWQGPQVTNGVLDTVAGINVIPSTADTASWDYVTDIWYAYSVNGGNTFTHAKALPGADKKKFAETCPSLDRTLEPIANGYRAHFVYIEQNAPFGQTPTADADAIAGGFPLQNLIYRTYDITLTGVEKDTKPVNGFELNQNYPNPFNPATSIKYSVPATSKVTLKVYDVLGKEVATLVNSVKAAGSYVVNFDASKLASGMYIYTLNTGNYSSSKKMMLLK